MRVTVIGTGNMGRGIGHRMVAGGNSATLVSRDPEETHTLAEELRGAAEGDATVEVVGQGEDLRDEVVILAVYYPITLEVVRGLVRGWRAGSWSTSPTP